MMRATTGTGDVRASRSEAAWSVTLLCVLGCAGAPIAAPRADQPWPRHTIDASSRGADGVRLADVNGDGLLDIATGWEEGGVVRVYLNPGATAVTRPWPAVTVGAVGSPEDAVVVDLDHDGAIDVLSSTEGAVKTLWVHWAPRESARRLDPAAWKTAALPASRGRAQWMFALPLDIDRAHGIDIVAGAKGNSAAVGWFEAPPDARDLRAWQWHSLHEAGWIMSLVADDVDLDGDADIVVSDRKGPSRGCLWLENPGAGPLLRAPWRAHPIGGQGREVMFLTMVDLDGDGFRDVVCAVRGKELLFLRRRGMSPVFEELSIDLPSYCGTGKAVAAGDLDRDGRLELVCSCENAEKGSGVVWLSFHRTPRERVWQAHDLSGPAGTKFDLVQLLDLDADGDLDVLTCEEAENLGVVWYENPGP